VKIAFSLV